MELSTFPKLGANERADVALVLEGTYPFIHGGVSSWIHQIIGGLPEIRFAIIFIGDRKQNYPEMKYKLPQNVVHLGCFFIMEQMDAPEPKARKGKQKTFDQIRAMHEGFQCPHSIDSGQVIGDVLKRLMDNQSIADKDFLYSQQAWSFISEQYQKNTGDSSFLNYFWTIRAMHAPVFTLLKVLDQVPDASVYHTLSTGYAGLFSVMIHHIKKRRVILTEHGIYTKERKIELSQVDWINDAEELLVSGLNEDFSYIRKLWIRFFESVGKLTYNTADPIITLTEGNRRRQIADGADPAKVAVVPNGVDLDQFKKVRESRPKTPPLVVGFIGRVVSIKDVKTFLRAMRTVSDHLPGVQGWIIGGEDEDPGYASECRDLVSSLDLEQTIIYKGFCNVVEVMANIGVVVLSSISEGLPLVTLEAFAGGRPVVATDVGACRELIEGGTSEDQALGKAGAVVNIADSEALANKMIHFLTDSEDWQQASNVAQIRVANYYSQDDLFTRYQKIYRELLES